VLDLELAIRFAAALALGLLLGLERERKVDRELMFGGIRTFALIALLGAAVAFAQQELDLGWLPPLTLIVLGALVISSYVVTANQGELGMTTEISALLTFIVGAVCGFGQIGVASAIAIACLLLLTLKGYLHRLAQRVEPADLEATLKFAIISVIILPLLPNETYGPPPIDVINPYKIWLMVVLIAGMNFVGYVLVKALGNEHGIGLTGVLGGLVSSTAATLSFSQRSRQEPSQASAFALAILLAWTIMFARIAVMVGIVDRGLALTLAIPLGLVVMVGMAISLVLWRRSRPRKRGAVSAGANPFELGEAVKFGLLFGAVTVAAKAAEVYLGERGLYLAGAIAGLTDVDAITLSMANLAAGQPESLVVAARTIVIAAVSNTLLKTGMAASMGAPALRRILIPIAALLLAAAAAGVLLGGRFAGGGVMRGEP
jgi:uncharacterized membrane protein (DUF4010 family)